MPSGPIAYAWRGMRRTPGVLVLVVLTLALGIGGATAMFAVVDAVLLNPLPYPNGDRLRELFIESVARQPESLPRGGPPRRDPRPDRDVRRGRAVWDGRGDADRRRSRHGRVAGLSAGFLQVLGAAPILGRLFTAEEADRGDRVVLVSEQLWRTRFGGAADIVGRRIGIEGEPHTIVGVLPARFAYPERTAASGIRCRRRRGRSSGVGARSSPCCAQA